MQVKHELAAKKEPVKREQKEVNEDEQIAKEIEQSM